MSRAPPMEFVPLSDEDMTAAEIRRELARLAGLYAHRVGAGLAIAALMNIARALQPGGRA